MALNLPISKNLDSYSFCTLLLTKRLQGHPQAPKQDNNASKDDVYLWWNDNALLLERLKCYYSIIGSYQSTGSDK
jgi:hypothetical protein